MAVELQLIPSKKDGISILGLRGSLLIGESEAKLRESINELASAGNVNLILDCSEVKQIDDDGLGALILCDAKLRGLGGSLKLVNINRIHMKDFILLRLDTVFQGFETEQDAVNSFFPDRLVKRYDILKFVEEQEKDTTSEFHHSGL